MSINYTYKVLGAADTGLVRQLMKVFADSFGDKESYQRAVPSEDYTHSLLSKSSIVVLVAMHNENIVGGLVAYELEKLEQDRRELYIYDLAISEMHRRKGLATSLINELKKVAVQKNAYVIYVQADKEDIPAIKLYESLGTKEDVYHFDITL